MDFTTRTAATPKHETLPRCRLHGVRLVDKLPARCPLREGRSIAELTRRKNDAWAVLGDPSGDRGGALLELEILDTCESCVLQLAGHPVIQRLRRKLAATAAPPAPAAVAKRSAAVVPMAVRRSIKRQSRSKYNGRQRPARTVTR